MEPIEILYQALAAKIGVVVNTNDATRAKQKLYAARRKAEDPSLDELEIRVSPFKPETQLFVLRKDRNSVAKKVSIST